MTGSHLFLAAGSLCQRELVRFLRQRHRVIGAFATPIVFWLLIGGGMGHSFHAAGQSGDATAGQSGYMQYFFPGTVLMILLFTAIFSTISVIEDRREGFLQSVLVAPVSRMAIVLGKVLGGTVLATGQGFLFLLLAPTVRIHLTVLSIVASVGFMALISFALTAPGSVHRLADELDARIPRDHESVSHADVVSLRCTFPRQRRTRWIGLGDAAQSAELWPERLAAGDFSHE